MASNYSVSLDTGVMRAVARTVENQMTIIRNCYASIKSDAQMLQGTYWEGFSADTYYEKMTKLCNDQQVAGSVTAGHIVRILQEYAKDLRFAADEYDRNEGRVTSRVEGLATNVFDV